MSDDEGSRVTSAAAAGGTDVSATGAAGKAWSLSSVCVFDHSIGAIVAYLSQLYATESDSFSDISPAITAKLEKMLPLHAFPDGLHQQQIDSFCFTLDLPHPSRFAENKEQPQQEVDDEKDAVTWNVASTFVQLLDTECPPKAVVESLGLDGVAANLVVNACKRHALQIVISLLTYSEEPVEIARNSFFGSAVMLDEAVDKLVKSLIASQKDTPPAPEEDLGLGVLPVKLVASQAIFPVRTRYEIGCSFYSESFSRLVDILSIEFMHFFKAAMLGQPMVIYGLPLHVLTYSLLSLKYFFQTSKCDAEKWYDSGKDIYPLVSVPDVVNVLRSKASIVGTSSILYTTHPPDFVHFTASLDTNNPSTSFDEFLEDKVSLTSADERFISNLLAFDEGESLENRGKFMETICAEYVRSLLQLASALSSASESSASLGLSSQIEDFGLSFVREVIAEQKNAVASVQKIEKFSIVHPGHSDSVGILGLEIPTISTATVTDTMKAIASSKPVSAVTSAASSLVSPTTVSSVTSAARGGFGMVGSAFTSLWKSVDNFLTDMDQPAESNPQQELPLLSSGNSSINNDPAVQSDESPDRKL
eukprot:TRINITY_DN8820_c0_g1_i3.p1 TRINITY_DN8820_c0_g1~~TRINITY_DN8820_c0_g1_i3.p1  ORF type:complete len:590 (-),score=166.78 TRINITY_DN8820_c0_g1_i3:751-2520(-)